MSDAVDLFSRCFGCGHEFVAGDKRLRFDMTEWEAHEGLPASIPSGLVEVGLCEECIEPGDFKDPETVGRV